jgi:hypothetical protein
MRVAAFAALVLALAASPATAATFYVTTGLGTHEATIDADHPVSWGFFADTTYSHFAGGVFAMKHGAGTDFGIKMELLDANTDPLGSVSFADVVAYLGAGGSSDYDRFVFMLDAIGYALHYNSYYIVKLSLVGDGDPAGQSYSIRGLDDQISFEGTDDPDEIVVTDSGNTATEVPEPATALILGAGLLGLGLCRRGGNAAA